MKEELFNALNAVDILYQQIAAIADIMASIDPKCTPDANSIAMAASMIEEMAEELHVETEKVWQYLREDKK